MTPDLCICCDGPATVTFKPTRDRASWLILQCDECHDSVCRDCTESVEGIVTCTLCLQQTVFAEQAHAARDKALAEWEASP